jgi:hypothetical protein
MSAIPKCDETEETSTIGGSPVRCESGDQCGDEGCECDSAVAALRRECD